MIMARPHRLAILLGLVVLAAPGAGVAASPPAGDAAMGARLFLQCRACHTVGPGGASISGPNLHGVAGAKAGTRPGYAYSPALARSGIVWTPANLDAFLAKPSAVAPGTRMIFAGIASPKARADLIAYMATLK